MTDLERMLVASCDESAALEAVRRWKVDDDPCLLDEAFRLMLPFMRRVRRDRFHGVRRQDVDDVDSYVAMRLYRQLLRKRYPDFQDTHALRAWARMVGWRLCSDALEDAVCKREHPLEDRVRVLRMLLTPRDGSALSSENRIFLAELPETVCRRVVESGRLEPQDVPAFEYIVRRLFHGEVPSPQMLTHEFIVKPRHARFLCDLANFTIRKVLHEMYEESPEVLLGHPVQFLLEADSSNEEPF